MRRRPCPAGLAAAGFVVFSGVVGWPNFVVIGAARSGTTALHHLLGRHPDVFMSPVKEPNFFAARDGRMGGCGPGARWLEEVSVTEEKTYRALFDQVRDESAVGEVSPRYMVTVGAAERIRQAIPDARIVAILRQPVDRAFASFLSLRRDGIEPLADFRSALEDEPRRDAEAWAFGRYLFGSRYAEQLRPYFALWPRDRIRVYLQEDLRTTPQEVQRDLFSFLGVDESPLVDEVPTANPTVEIPNPLLAAMWRHSHDLRVVLRRWVPRRARDRVLDRLTRGGSRPSLDAKLRAELVERLRPEIDELSRLLERDLSDWLEDPNSQRFSGPRLSGAVGTGPPS